MPLLWPNENEPTTPIQNGMGFVVLFLWIAFILWCLVNPY